MLHLYVAVNKEFDNCIGYGNEGLLSRQSAYIDFKVIPVLQACAKDFLSGIQVVVLKR